MLTVAAAYLIDLAAGDPHWLPHPVRLIGRLISALEKGLRSIVDAAAGKYAAGRDGMERTAGVFLALMTVAGVSAAVYLVLEAAKYVHPALFHLLNIYFIYSSFAARCLADEVMKVYGAVAGKDLPEARKRVAMLVGRETRDLDDEGVIRAAVETTAENTVDGVISPVVFAVLGSLLGLAAPLAYAFKAASTLDSMVGYKNDRYLNFGRASAKLDDALNYLPARMSGLLIPAAAFICGKGFSGSFRIMLRDRRKHASPNCAYPEAAMAGALGVRLGGGGVYFGRTVEKPTVGDAVKQLEAGDIADSVKIMYVSSLLTLLAGLGVLLGFAG